MEMFLHAVSANINKYHIEWFEGQACPRVMDILEVDEADLGKLSTNSLL